MNRGVVGIESCGAAKLSPSVVVESTRSTRAGSRLITRGGRRSVRRPPRHRQNHREEPRGRMPRPCRHRLCALDLERERGSEWPPRLAKPSRASSRPPSQARPPRTAFPRTAFPRTARDTTVARRVRLRLRFGVSASNFGRPAGPARSPEVFPARGFPWCRGLHAIRGSTPRPPSRFASVCDTKVVTVTPDT